MNIKVVLALLILVLYTEFTFANQCSDFFPGPRPIAAFGSIDYDLKENVDCNGSSNCSLESLSSKRIPTLPNNTVNLGTFNLNSVQDFSYNAYRSWGSSVTSVSVVSGTAVIYFNANGNDIEIPENSQINASGSPSALLIVVTNGKLKVGKNSTINAYIYADTEEVKFEENTTFTGGLTVVDGKLIIEKDSSYDFVEPNANFNPHDFCEFSVTPSEPPVCSEIFPGPTSFSANGSVSIGKDTTCDGSSCSPINNFTQPVIPSVSPSGSFNQTNISDGVYEHTSWGLSKEAVVNFSGNGTAVLYFSGNVSIPKETKINDGGDAANVMIIAAGTISIAKDARINAHIYAAGSISLAKNIVITGSVSANGALTIDKDGTYVYNSGDADNISGHGFCSGSVAPAVDHYLITHDGQGLTCASEAITIKACTNSFDGSCSESTDAISLDLVAQGISGHQVTRSVNFTGNTTVNLDYRVDESATLSIENAGTAATNGFVCNDNNTGDCDIKFDVAGFIFSGFNQVNGSLIEVAGEENNNITIQAVEDDGTGVCQSYFTDAGARDIGFAVKVPSNASLNYEMNSTSIAKFTGSSPSSYTQVSLNFDAQSRATLPGNIYYDAADIVLFASHTIAATPENPAVTLTGSQGLYVRPYKFVIKATTPDDTALNNTDHLGEPLLAAGQKFNLTITAVNAGEATTPSFSKNIDIALERLLPNSTAAFDGTLNIGSASLDSDNQYDLQLTMQNGTYTSTESNYTEVGVVKLHVQDATSNSTASGQQTIGRFTPHHFYLATGAVNNFCSDMTYMSQDVLDIQYQLEARNAGDAVTKNYIDDFFKSPTIVYVAENANNGANLNSSIAPRLLGLGGTWAGGVFNVANYAQFARLATLDGPYDEMRFGLQVEDSDGITFKTSALDMLDNGSANTAQQIGGGESKIRFGRWVTENAYGPETSDLPVDMRVEYWDGTNWQVNSADSCTSLIAISAPNGRESGAIDSGNLTDGEYRLDGFNYLSSKGASIAANTSFFEGILDNKVVFDAAGENNTGKLEFEYQVPLWLQFDWRRKRNFTDNPVSKLQFGLFRGNDRIIYWREVGN